MNSADHMTSEVHRLTLGAADALLCDQGFHLADCPPQERDIECGGEVSFSGPEISGRFVAFLGRHTSLAVPPDLRADWLCELVNQLAGRVKTRLRGHGYDYGIQPPRAVRLPASFALADDARQCFYYERDGGACVIGVELSHLGEADPEVDTEGGLEEGELCLF